MLCVCVCVHVMGSRFSITQPHTQRAMRVPCEDLQLTEVSIHHFLAELTPTTAARVGCSPTHSNTHNDRECMIERE